MSKPKSKKLRRNQIKHPALRPEYNPRNRAELIDMDYLSELSQEELAWLNKFMEEYNGANMNFKNLKKNLHNNKRLKKDCTDRVNARNRDLFSIAKINGLLKYDPQNRTQGNVADLYENENAIIERIDEKYNPEDDDDSK